MLLLENFSAEIAPPKAGAMINTFRSFGYNLRTAIADIIDNSISANAKNIWINYTWKGADSFVTILDDGSGMSQSELVEAMTPGSKDPNDERPINDLGRFGLGLKTASFSQCKSLTVATKSNNESIIKRCWNLEYVNQTGSWTLLDYISSPSLLENLNSISCGTLVVWELMDRLVGSNTLDTNEAARKVFLEEFEIVEKHLSLVFHRYLEKKKIKIWMNDMEVLPWDPFMKHIVKGKQLIAEELLNDDKIKVKCYVLPHASLLDEEDRKNGGGSEGWYAQQGFYIYRNERLLVAGDWLGLFPKLEHYKLARILVDIPNDMDNEWKIDIKKAVATPPTHLRKDFQRLALSTRLKAGEVHKFRANQLIDEDGYKSNFKPIWKTMEDREQTRSYKINRNHPIIEQIINKKEITQKDIKFLLSIIETSVPVEVIIQNHNEDPEKHELRDKHKEPNDAIIEVAKKMFESLKIGGVSPEIAIKQILSIEPFSNYKQLIEYLK